MILSMLAIRGIQISKAFHYYQVLRDVSFEVAEGACYALLGPNGAGKTTLLRVLATLQRPTAGRFEILGLDGTRERDRIRERILFLGHGSHLYDELNAVENLRFSLALHGVRPTAREIKLTLDRVGIGAFADLRIRNYSMGMKKRLSIAKAVLAQPRVLLLDEPYTSLDEAGMKMMNRFISELNGTGAAVFLTTHDRLRSAEVATQAGIIKRGELKEIAIKDLAGHEPIGE